MKNIAVLGSTGSIGRQTLDVVRSHPALFHISVLAANSSDELLERPTRGSRHAIVGLPGSRAGGRPLSMRRLSTLCSSSSRP